MIEVSVNQADRMPVSEALIERAVKAVLEAEDVESCDFSVTFLGDAGMRELNRDYLDHDWSTDVLSFALDPGGESPAGAVEGEVYIGADRAHSQARERKIAPEVEAVRLAVHGTLHVLGYDHPEEGREKSPFFERQEALVRRVVEAWPV